MIKLWLCLNVVRLQLVVDYRVHEKKVKDLILLICNNNINTFLTTIEKMRIVINSMFPDKQDFAEHRFVTIMFYQILKSSYKEFFTNVKQAKRDWTENPKNFDCASAMVDLTKLYTNYTYIGHRDKADDNAATIIALVTALKKESDKDIPKVTKNPGSPGDGRPGLEIWKFDNVGKFKNIDGVKHLFCTEHGHKNDKGNDEMYMLFPHNHTKCIS